MLGGQPTHLPTPQIPRADAAGPRHMLSGSQRAPSGTLEIARLAVMVSHLPVKKMAERLNKKIWSRPPEIQETEGLCPNLGSHPVASQVGCD